MTTGLWHRRGLRRRIDLLQAGTFRSPSQKVVRSLKTRAPVVSLAVDDASLLRRLACEPTKVLGQEQRFADALQQRDTAVQVRYNSP